jgi:hypothetical protein
MDDRQIQIPERRADEPPATPEQLALIRQLTAGLSLQGYRFDYRKLGLDQANTILKQLNAMNDQQTTPTKPAKQGPGCIASLAKGTTALIFWAVILAAVAGGGYFIYDYINKNPKPTANPDANAPDQQASTDTPNPPDRETRGSTIFEGLGVSDTPRTDATPADKPDQPATDPKTRPDPVTPTPPTVDAELAQQLQDLEEMLVSLSQYTRNDFAADIRARSAQGMQNKLEAFPQALSALQKIDPTLPPRIRAVIDAFGADQFDGLSLRNEIKSIREAIDTLQ